MCMLLLVCYTAHNVIHAYIVHVLQASILQNFSSDLHASVKFKLSSTIANSCLFTFVIVHTITFLVINVPRRYITHVSMDELM